MAINADLATLYKDTWDNQIALHGATAVLGGDTVAVDAGEETEFEVDEDGGGMIRMRQVILWTKQVLIGSVDIGDTSTYNGRTWRVTNIQKTSEATLFGYTLTTNEK